MGYGIKDVPWHEEFLRKATSDKRRDARNCRYRINKWCLCEKSPYHLRQCTSSIHCEYYYSCHDWWLKEREKTVTLPNGKKYVGCTYECGEEWLFVYHIDGYRIEVLYTSEDELAEKFFDELVKVHRWTTWTKRKY